MNPNLKKRLIQRLIGSYTVSDLASVPEEMLLAALEYARFVNRRFKGYGYGPAELAPASHIGIQDPSRVIVVHDEAAENLANIEDDVLAKVIGRIGGKYGVQLDWWGDVDAPWATLFYKDTSAIEKPVSAGSSVATETSCRKRPRRKQAHASKDCA